MATEISQNRTVTSKQLKTSLRHLVKSKRPAFVWGGPGIGKSDCITSLCEEYSGMLFDVRLSQISETDLRGMPYFDPIDRQMKWAPPIDLPSAEVAAKYPYVFLFLDEMNSAQPSVLAAAYQLILNRKVGTYSLPDNCIVFAAGNRSGDGGVTFRMPKPLANRMIHFEMRVDFDSWNEWAFDHGIHPDVIGFLNHSKNSLYDFDPTSPNQAFASPRTWEYVSDVLWDELDEDTALNIISGTIGEGLALSFMAHRKVASNMPSPEDVFSGRAYTMGVKDISAQYSLITSLMYELKNTFQLMTAEGKIDDWHRMCDMMLGFIMANMETEIVVSGMRMGLTVMRIKMDKDKLSNFKRFLEGPGQLILKSHNISI